MYVSKFEDVTWSDAEVIRQCVKRRIAVHAAFVHDAAKAARRGSKPFAKTVTVEWVIGRARAAAHLALALRPDLRDPSDPRSPQWSCGAAECEDGYHMVPGAYSVPCPNRPEWPFAREAGDVEQC